MRRIDEYDYFGMCQKMSLAMYGGKHIPLAEWKKICDGTLEQLRWMHARGVVDASAVIGEK